MDQHQLHRLTDRQYSEVEGLLLQAMEMPSSDHEEIELDTCGISKYNTSLFEGRQRCYTMPHVPPPAPPSTPTLLTTTTTTSANGGAANGGSPNTTISIADSNQVNHFIYVKNGKNLRRETRCIDAELSKLLNVVSITNRQSDTHNITRNRTNSSSSSSNSSGKQHIGERGILNASRTISKLHGTTKIFKIHRDPKEFLRETDEDSVSAPEYDEEEKEVMYTRFRFSRRLMRRHTTRMDRKFARFEHHERMETIVDNFVAAMNFKDADT